MDIYSREFEEKLVSIVPNERQMRILKMGYYNFIHFGLNTYTGKEWGSGKVPTSEFGLKSLDTDNWVKDLMSTGSKGVILTAKHHDGFCLFQSRYTDYSIANTAYMQGKGDIVRQLADSCKKYGFKMGIYLSPWDRHEPTYGSEAYNDYFVNQLTELCTNYGEIFCFWFDGACGEGKNGRKQVYDWKRYYETIHKYQPDTIISNCAPDVRWIGNEAGKARNSEWSVVSTRLRAQDMVAANSQQQAGAAVMLRKIDATDEDLGSRELLVGEELCYYPSEMDISASYIGWFYRKTFEWFLARSVKNLVQCFLTSVGNNATLLVNVAPNKRGELPKKFINRLVKARETIEEYFKYPIKTDLRQKDEYTYEICFNKATVSKVIIAEDITMSQRVESFTIYADIKEIFSGTTIGYKKFCFFEPIECEKLEIKINACRLKPHIKYVKAYK
jgi:alpha-L-fucosidase